MNILLNEFQLQMPEGATYLPYASGLLAAYAKAYCKRRNELRFHFEEDYSYAYHLSCYSVSQWNLNRSLKHASYYDKDQVVFGGPSACEVKDYPVIIGEGEHAFAHFLDTGEIPSIAQQVLELDDIPSPYTTGLFDHLLMPSSQAIVETVRGCPFGCAYCCWGKGGKAGKNVRMHSLAYVKEEAEWMGINKIQYVFCADGNFGMFPRDVEVARIYADVKRRYGYPQRFRVCFGKNAEESIFETASVLAEAELIKSVTLSRQSTNPEALLSVGRANVSQKTFDNLQDRYANEGIPTYSELIFGLPGETYASFKQSIIDSMRRDTQLFIYPLSALPGSRLHELEYRIAYGIRTRKVLMTPVHCVPPAIPEYEEIVMETNTLDPEDWRRGMVLSWLVQLFYSFKLAEGTPENLVTMCDWMCDVLNLGHMPRWQEMVLAFYCRANDMMLLGKGRCAQCDLYGPAYWEPEEYAFLGLCLHKNSGVLEELANVPALFNIEFHPERVPTITKAPQEFAQDALLHARKSNMKKKGEIR